MKRLLKCFKSTICYILKFEIILLKKSIVSSLVCVHHVTVLLLFDFWAGFLQMEKSERQLRNSNT